jgi:CRISPR-associated endonuclease/helicase Cas3
MHLETIRFFAHSTGSQDQSDWEPLLDHLNAVAQTAGKHAAKYGAGELGRTAALLHDLGKYSDKFQKRLMGASDKVDHAAPGAYIAEAQYGKLGKLIGFAIAGHHAGLADGTLTAQTQSRVTPLSERLPQHAEAGRKALTAAKADGLDLSAAPLTFPEMKPRSKDGIGFSCAFLARMIFSTLVDADYVETERFYAEHEGRAIERGDQTSLAALRSALDVHLVTKIATAPPTPLNELRAQILLHVRAGAERARGVFTLTVPTGGGKTLASLAFALDHAIQHHLDRVIVVIPFTSIIEQTAAVYREAFGVLGGTVLEHHSAFEEDNIHDREARDKLNLAMENWDARVVVTTAVQFFESLFANRTSRCRKLHNIARSVIVLDEVQTLPLALLKPSIAALDELVRNYGSTVVLCTATQPALSETDDPRRSFKGGFRYPHELAPNVPQLFAALKRVTVQNAGDLSDGDLADRMADAGQALTIVNTRKHASALFAAISAQPGARLLTTALCAKHRRAVLEGIRADLKGNRPCRLVATSLIEAGVDIDFPLVLRAEAGLDSIAQAAGRCNREGKRRAEDSLVVVFEPIGHKPLPALNHQADAGRSAFRRFDDPLGPQAIEHYFNELYWVRGEKALDEKHILDLIAERTGNFDFPFETIARLFRLIEETMLPVIVPWDDDAKRAIEQLPLALRTSARKLQSYVVPVPRNARMNLVAVGAVRLVEEKRFGDQFAVLENRDIYKEATGLDWNDPTYLSAAGLIG